MSHLNLSPHNQLASRFTLEPSSTGTPQFLTLWAVFSRLGLADGVVRVAVLFVFGPLAVLTGWAVHDRTVICCRFYLFV